MLVKYKISKDSYVDFKNLIRITRAKICWRKRRKTTPKLKKMNCGQSRVLTRSVLHDILFNNG